MLIITLSYYHAFQTVAAIRTQKGLELFNRTVESQLKRNKFFGSYPEKFKGSLKYINET